MTAAPMQVFMNHMHFVSASARAVPDQRECILFYDAFSSFCCVSSAASNASSNKRWLVAGANANAMTQIYIAAVCPGHIILACYLDEQNRVALVGTRAHANTCSSQAGF